MRQLQKRKQCCLVINILYIICKNDTIIADIWIANNAIIKLWCHDATIVVEMINSTDTRNDWGQLWGLIYCHWHFEPHFILKPCIHTFYQISIAYDWCRDNSWRIVTWRYMTHFFFVETHFLATSSSWRAGTGLCSGQFYHEYYQLFKRRIMNGPKNLHC